LFTSLKLYSFSGNILLWNIKLKVNVVLQNRKQLKKLKRLKILKNVVYVDLKLCETFYNNVKVFGIMSVYNFQQVYSVKIHIYFCTFT